MPRESARNDETRQRMLELDPIERVSTLAMSILQMHPTDTKAAVHGMLAMIKAMAKMYGHQKRGEIVNQCRDAADIIERPLHLVN